jgi:hypothetical protein
VCTGRSLCAFLWHYYVFQWNTVYRNLGRMEQGEWAGENRIVSERAGKEETREKENKHGGVVAYLSIGKCLDTGGPCITGRSWVRPSAFLSLSFLICKNGNNH